MIGKTVKLKNPNPVSALAGVEWKDNNFTPNPVNVEGLTGQIVQEIGRGYVVRLLDGREIWTYAWGVEIVK